jgi:hypothetical protein
MLVAKVRPLPVATETFYSSEQAHGYCIHVEEVGRSRGKGREGKGDLLQFLALNFQRVVFLLFSQPKTGVPVPRVCHMRQARP